MWTLKILKYIKNHKNKRQLIIHSFIKDIIKNDKIYTLVLLFIFLSNFYKDTSLFVYSLYLNLIGWVLPVFLIKGIFRQISVDYHNNKLK